MSNATVFILLLDAFTGFDRALNETIQNLLQTKKNSQHKISNIKKCDSLSANTLIQIIGKTNYSTQTNEIDQINVNSLLELNKTIEKEIQDNNFDIKEEFRSKNDDFPASAPYLVAIFESLLNVTAQTCAGTLLSSDWVLTAAACVDVLPQLYSSKNVNFSTNPGNYSRYTIIANATNPLIDGTVYDVIEIILQYPSQSDVNKRKLLQHLTLLEGPGVALMKINSEIGVQPLRILEGVVKEKVTVFGWKLLKNGTGRDEMASASFTAYVTDPSNCKTENRIFKSDIICLSAFNHSDSQLNQVSSGGPVIAVVNGKLHILAVVQAIYNFFITASLVAPHYALDNIIHNN